MAMRTACCFATRTGEIVDGDEILAIAALDFLQAKRLRENTLVATVMSNFGLDETLAAAGGKVLRTKVGDRYVLEEMMKRDLNVGGEQSGHMIFRDFSTTGDGIVCALQILRIMKTTGKPLSELKRCLTKYPQAQRNLRVKQKPPLEELEGRDEARRRRRATVERERPRPAPLLGHGTEDPALDRRPGTHADRSAGGRNCRRDSGGDRGELMTLPSVVEALLFSAQKPLTTKELASAIRAAGKDDDPPAPNEYSRINEAEIAAALEQLKIEYIEQGRAFQLVEKAEGWQLASDPAYATWVRQLFPAPKTQRLSPPALETLAIVAYRQPITRADIEAVRGVAVEGVLQNLMERGLVKIGGRAEVPGRPLLYETTEFFLEHFGLKNLDELPNAEELRRRYLPTAPTPTPAPEATQPELEPLPQEAPPEEEPQERAEEQLAPEERPQS